MRKNPIVEIELFKNNDAGVKFHVKQFDDLRINAKVFDGTEEVDISNQNITVFVLKEDKTIIEQKKDILVEDNTIKINFSKQATTAMGKCQLEILLKDEDGTSATSTISYMVNEKLSASISEIIKSEDDIDSLDMIEDFIQASNVDILEIKEAIQDIKDNYETVLDGKKDEILDLLSNAEAEITARIESKGEEILEVANTTMEKAEEAIEAIDEALEDINNIQNVIDVALSDIETAKDGALEDLETIKTASTEEISTLKDTALEEVSSLRDNAISDISDLKDESINNITDLKESTIEDISNLKDSSLEEIGALKDGVISDINTAKDNAIEDITALKDESIEEMNVVKAEVLEGLEGAIDEINTAKDGALEDLEGAISEINTAKENALEEVKDTKDGAILAMKEEEAGIIERISEIEISGTTGVDEAVKQAQKRLQELTIQSTWEVSQEAIVQAKGLEGVAGEQKALIRELAEAQKESVANAGAEIVEMVENLDADIEQGLADINRTIVEGRTDIITNANNQVSRIQAEGQEIIDAVANLEMTTQDNIKDINEAGLSARQSIESKANAEINQINFVASNRKQEINELTENKIEAITNAGDEKLSEIREIVTTTEEDVVELLETTREEINTHRASINTSVSEGLSNISNLKSESISEMTTKKEDLIEEILSAEIDMKNDFKDLAEEYTNSINELGSLKVESLQNMIEAIDNLEESVENNLKNSQKRAEDIRENFNNIFESTDNKMAEIRPILDSLSEMRALCNDLLSENAEANENIEELDFLHVESDTRIVEMRLLLDECKRYENVLVDYIESKGGNHDEIEARLTALEENVIAVDDALNALEEAIENIDLSHLATKEEIETAKTELQEAIDAIEIPNTDDFVSIEALDNYATKETLEGYATKEDLEKLDGAMKIVGVFGSGTEKINIPESMQNLELPAGYTDKEVKHTLIFKPNVTSGSQYYIKVFFFVDLNDSSDGKYARIDGNSFSISKLTQNTDYVQMRTTSSTSKPTSVANTNAFSMNITYGTTAVYYYDFPIFNNDGSEVLFKNPNPISDENTKGLSNFNDAKENGYYLINMSYAMFRDLYNAPDVKIASNIKGYLEVLNGIQVLKLIDGQVFIREIGKGWSSATIDSYKNHQIGKIGASTGIPTPSLFKNMGGDVRPFSPYKKYTIFYRQSENQYVKAIIMPTHNDGLKCYWANNQYLEFGNKYYYQIERYNTSTNSTEYINESVSSGYISGINKDYFTVYATDCPIYTDSNYTTLYKDVTIADYDIKETIQDFNSATDTGFYEVEIDEEATIENKCDEGALSGTLEVIKTDSCIKQSMTTNEDVLYTRVRNNEEWTEWKNRG